MEAGQHPIGDDATVDRARDVLRSSGRPYLLVHDLDGRCVGVVDSTTLTTFLGRSWFTERTALRNLTHQRGPYTSPDMPLGMARLAMKVQRRTVLPVVDPRGHILGAVTMHGINAALGLRQ
jgi:CBS domain-containing protein